MRQIKGPVVKGQGLATGFLSDGVFEKALGKIHKGTINVLVPDPNREHWILQQPIDPGSVRAAGGLRFCPCTIEGHKAIIVSSWHPGATYPPERRYPGHTLLEIVAEAKIPGIAYGSVVTVEYNLDERQLKAI